MPKPQDIREWVADKKLDRLAGLEQPQPKCGAACPCCGRYELVGTHAQWQCQWCNQVGTLLELAAIRAKQWHPGDVVYEDFSDLNEQENNYVNQVRLLGFETQVTSGKDAMKLAQGFVRVLLGEKQEEMKGLARVNGTMAEYQQEVREKNLAKVFNVETVKKEGRVLFTDENQNE